MCIHKSRILLMLLVVSFIVGKVVHAAESIEMKVQATVLSICKVDTVRNIEFGVIDPSQQVNIVSSGGIAFKCTKGVDFRIAVDNGLHFENVTSRRRMRSENNFYLPYALSSDSLSGVGLGFTTPVTLNITASINSSDFRDLPATTYQDTIKITLEP